MRWGEFDCAVGLAAGAVEAQTGVDLGADHKAQYSDERSARDYLSSLGWTDSASTLSLGLQSAMDAVLDRADPARPHRGNIVLLTSDLGPALALRTGRKAVAFSKAGMMEFPIPDGAPEWRPC